MTPIFLNDWAETKMFGLISDFDDIYITPEEYAMDEAPYPNKEMFFEKKQKMARALASDEWNIEILLASYTYECYSGDAFVLFRQDGKLYEVNGGHCSCYGLEGQWSPEETTIESLEHRLDNGSLGDKDYNPFADELRQVLEQLKHE